jgi:hypothetical protein
MFLYLSMKNTLAIFFILIVNTFFAQSDTLSLLTRNNDKRTSQPRVYHGFKTTKKVHRNEVSKKSKTEFYFKDDSTVFVVTNKNVIDAKWRRNRDTLWVYKITLEPLNTEFFSGFVIQEITRRKIILKSFLGTDIYYYMRPSKLKLKKSF